MEERIYPVISQTAKNIPMDCIESPYTIHIDENRSRLTGKIHRSDEPTAADRDAYR